jgi:hypothetical protein
MVKALRFSGRLSRIVAIWASTENNRCSVITVAPQIIDTIGDRRIARCIAREKIVARCTHRVPCSGGHDRSPDVSTDVAEQASAKPIKYKAAAPTARFWYDPAAPGSAGDTWSFAEGNMAGRRMDIGFQAFDSACEFAHDVQKNDTHHEQRSKN